MGLPVSPMRPAARPKIWWVVLMAATLLMGIGLRFDQLGQRSLWADELFTAGIALFHDLTPAEGKPWFERKQVLHITDGDSFLTAKAAEQSPPLNDLLEKATLTAFGPHEWAARLPAVLSATFLLCWAGTVAWRAPDPWSRRVLTWNLLLLSLYPVLVYYAKDGRAYSLGASLVGAALLLWWQRWRDGLLHWKPLAHTEILLWALACYSHYNAAVVAVLIGLLEIWASRRMASRTGRQRTISLGLLFAPWIFLNIHTVLFTTKGGVAWQTIGWQQRAMMAADHMSMAVHWPWLIMVAGGWALVNLVRKWQGKDAPAACPPVSPYWLLPMLAACYLVIAALIVAKAGMAHPRYYIFAGPLLALWMAMVLAQIKQPKRQALALALVVALAAPKLWELRTNKNEDFRSMTHQAIAGAPGDTPFLYPWRPNQHLYRVYLEWMLEQDPRSRMHGLSTPAEFDSTCKKLSGHDRLAVMGHDSGHRLIDGFYAHCGRHWPIRKTWQFDNTFTEHWSRP